MRTDLGIPVVGSFSDDLKPETPWKDLYEGKGLVPAVAYKLHDEHKTIGCIRESCRHELEQAKSKSQTYFANLAGEMRRPHFGEQFREIYRALLLRAQEAGLYTPEET